MDSRIRVMVIGPIHADSVAQHISETFEAMGIEAVRFDPGRRISPTAGRLRKRYEQVRVRVVDPVQNIDLLRERFVRRLIDTARQQPLSLIVVCHDFLMPREVDRLKDATGTPMALWFPDHIGNMQKAWFLNADYDVLFFKDPFIVDTLSQKLSARILYLPECFNPARLRAPELTEEDRAEFGCDIATAGNLYSYRAAFFAGLDDYDVKIWGNPPPSWMDVSRLSSMIQNRYVVNDDKARAFRAARVVVNSMNPAEVYGLNARAFEVCGAGGFQLVDWRPGLAEFFHDGLELVSFRTIQDLREKIDHYLAKPEERHEIARRGQERASRDHTFEIRLRLMLDTVLGDADGYPMPAINASLVTRI